MLGCSSFTPLFEIAHMGDRAVWGSPGPIHSWYSTGLTLPWLGYQHPMMIEPLIGDLSRGGVNGALANGQYSRWVAKLAVDKPSVQQC